MSDSDEEDLQNNVFTFQNNNMTVSACGPSINTSTRRFHSSTLHMPRNFERQRYAESEYGQPNSYGRRETSPMSIASACDMSQRNFNNLYYSRNPGISHGSIINGYGGSQMSVRSGDSVCSRVSAVDIIAALNNDTFSNRETRSITEAYRKFMKRKYRNKSRHRRHIPWSLKVARSRRKSGYDSGAQASDSSISSDEISTRTSNYKENMSDCRSTKTDMSDFRRNIQETSQITTKNIPDYRRIIQDRERDNGFRHNFLQSIGGPINLNNTQTSVSSFRSNITKSIPVNFKNMCSQPVTMQWQKDRFKSVMLLPSQRFNKSIASATIHKDAVTGGFKSNMINNKPANERKDAHTNVETDSEQEDIFSDMGNKKQNIQRKRSIDYDEVLMPVQKRPKVASPCKNTIKKNRTKENSVNKSNDFVFAKPLMPVSKSFNFKNREKCIAKSAAPLNSIQPILITPIEGQRKSSDEHVEKDDTIEDEPSNITQASDVSSRPSFMKRKLFTQKLDVAEKSTDNSLSHSPQNSIYSSIQKEKHKARKLQQTTTQSCLSRDVVQDESNFLDLIHKIVPLDQMNVTNQTNKTDIQNSRNKTEDCDKLDISSIISTRRDDNESDTFTDDEILNMTVNETVKKVVTQDPNQKKNELKVVVERIPSTILSTLKSKSNAATALELKSKSETGTITDIKSKPKTATTIREMNSKSNTTTLPELKSRQCNTQNKDEENKTIQTCVKSFWDQTDESEADGQSPQKNGYLKEAFREHIQSPETSVFRGFPINSNAEKITNTDTTVSMFTNTFNSFINASLKVRSHRAPKRKEYQTRDDSKPVLFEPRTKKQKTVQATNSELSKNTKQKTDLQKKKSDDTTCNKLPRDDKTIKTNPKNELKIDKPNKPIKEKPVKPSTASKKQEKSNRNKEIVQSKSDPKSGQDSKKTKNENTKTKAPTSHESKPKNKKRSPKNKKATKTTLKNNSTLNRDTSTEENNNTSQRPIRSCRYSKLNSTLEKSNPSINGTMSKSLRSRDVDLSSLNITKGKQKSVNAKTGNSNLSNVSFSLAATKTAKRAIPKLANSLINAKNIESSDVSFSLIDSPAPKTTPFANSKNNLKTGKNLRISKISTPMKKTNTKLKNLY